MREYVFECLTKDRWMPKPVGAAGEELVRCRECINWGSFPQGWLDDYCPVVSKCTRPGDWCCWAYRKEPTDE